MLCTVQGTKVLYNEVAQCVIAITPRKIADGEWAYDLQYRHRSSNDLSRISLPIVHATIGDVLSCGAAPLLLVNVWQRRTESAGSYDWHALTSVNLITKEAKSLFDCKTFPVPNGYSQGWLASLISVAPRGEEAVCGVGLKRNARAGTARIEYWLYKIKFADKSLERVECVDDLM